MQAHVFVSGFVQGIGFRHFVRAKAQDLELTGWVKNLPDGRVEAIFQSSASSDQEAKDKIEEAIKECNKGPFLSEIENITVEWEETKEKFDHFDII